MYSMALHLASTHRTKHILIHIHYIRDLIASKFVEMVHIPTHLQLADMFTKALGHQVFSLHIDTLLGLPPKDGLLAYLKRHLQRRSDNLVTMLPNTSSKDNTTA